MINEKFCQLIFFVIKTAKPKIIQIYLKTKLEPENSSKLAPHNYHANFNTFNFKILKLN